MLFDWIVWRLWMTDETRKDSLPYLVSMCTVITCHKWVSFYSHTWIYSIWAITIGMYLSFLSSTIGSILCVYCNVYNNYWNARMTPGSLCMYKYECQTCFSHLQVLPVFPSQLQPEGRPIRHIKAFSFWEAVKVTSLQLYIHYRKDILPTALSRCVFI